MPERTVSQESHAPVPTAGQVTLAPILEASAQVGPARADRVQAPPTELCMDFLEDGPKGLVLTLTPETMADVKKALESVPRPPGIAEGYTFPVGTVEIPSGFRHRTHHEVAAWYTDSEIPPQSATISRRHWGSGDSGPFVEPQGILKEHYTPTLFGGVRVGDYDPFASAGEATYPQVGLQWIPMPAIVAIHQPELPPGPALTATERLLLGRIADQLPSTFREFAADPTSGVIRAPQLAGPGFHCETVESSLSYLAQMGYLQRIGQGEPVYSPARWAEIQAFRGATPVEPAREIHPPFRQPDQWQDHDYRSTGELIGARPVWFFSDMAIAGPRLIPEVIKPHGLKEQKQADATLLTLFHRAVMVANGQPPAGHYHGLDDHGRHRVT